MQLQKYPNAISALSKAIELAPTFHAYDNRAAAYGCMRDWNALIADATKATLLNPRDSISFGNRAMAYNELGQFAQAQADYLKAIHLNPSQATFYEGLGELLCKEKRYSSALEYLDRALERMKSKVMHTITAPPPIRRYIEMQMPPESLGAPAHLVISLGKSEPAFLTRNFSLF